MTRERALQELLHSPYPSQTQLEEDNAFVIKKLGFSPEEFENYLKQPAIDHEQYGTEKSFLDFLLRIKRTFS
jgi:hypothetical protein